MNIVGINTLVYKEWLRLRRVPFQAVAQPVITTLLYFLVFGAAIGGRIGEIHGLSYAEFMMPGLLMMNVMIVSFFSLASEIILSKIWNTLSDLLVSPLSYFDIIAGYTIATVIRAVIVAALIFGTALFFVPLRIDHPIFLFVFVVVIAAAFALLGLIAGIWAENFEQVTIFPTLLLTPLAFLGGIFYSISMLPSFAQTFSHVNPFFYMVNGMRYGFYGVSDANPWLALLIVLLIFGGLFALAWNILRTGYKIRS